MLHLLYSLTVLMYAGLIHVVSPFNAKARLWVAGRRKAAIEGFRNKRKPEEKWIWFHCASLGEYEDCMEVFRNLAQEMPTMRTLLTFSSPSGYEALKDSGEFDHISYLPADLQPRVNAFLDILQPSLVLFARSELWLNYIFEIHQRRIPLFLISLKLTASSGFLKWPAVFLYQKAFGCFTYIFCQDTQTVALLGERLGIDATSVTGNTRYNRICSAFAKSPAYPEIERFKQDDFTIIAGSYLARDLKIIRKAIPALLAMHCRLILVPHEVVKSEIEKLIAAFPGSALVYSDIQQLHSDHRILVIDHVGSLKDLYKYADLALVGGGFNRIGIHNVIEPAVYGLVTLFGPNHRNYQEALDLISMEAGFVFSGNEELLALAEKQMRNQETIDVRRKQISEYVQSKLVDQHIILSTIWRMFREHAAD